MPTLGVQEGALGGREDLVLLKLSGTLDIATLPQFEGALNRLRAADRHKVAVDLSQLDYISSSGLGSFLGMVDHFRQAGGDLAFVRLAERVQKIFKVVGFHRLLTILPTEAEALQHFGSPARELKQFLLTPATLSPHSGEAFDIEVIAADPRGEAFEAFNGDVSLRPTTGIVSPAKIGPFKGGIWRGQVVLTGPGPVGLRAVQGEVAGEARFDVGETKPPATLPVQVRCPGCQQPEEIRAFNVYRCRHCDEIYFVDKWAHAISLKAGQRGAPLPPKVLSLTLPADVNLLAAVRGFITTVLREYGYGHELVNDLELAADEAVTNVVEHAYQYDVRKSLTLELRLEKDRVQVLVKDQGQPYQPTVQSVDLEQHIAERRTGGLGVHLMHAMMDAVDYRREDGQNVLVLTKKAARA
jgi:anti-anti-sigma factor